MLLCQFPLPSPTPSGNIQLTSPVCPSCSNVLTVSKTRVPIEGQHNQTEESNRLECLTCPYQYILTKRYYERKTFERVERDDVFGGPAQWDNAPKANIQCDRKDCEGREATWYQVQIRSADEPMTIFYKVSGRRKCGIWWISADVCSA